MNKIKLWESKSRLLKKLQKEKVSYSMKRYTYLKENPPMDEIELLHVYDVKGVSQAYHKPKKRVSPWDNTLELLDVKINHVANSGAYIFAKKIAKGRRKAGR